MNMKIIASDLSASLKSYLRSKGTLFWSLAFPILLILLFGAIFSGGGDKYDLYIKNYDYRNGEVIAQMLQENDENSEFLGNFTNLYDAIYWQFNNTNQRAK